MEPRSYGGETAQERRTRRRAALAEAALDLFAEGGLNQVTKRNVCTRARLNDRYFYEHFTDRDALLESVAQDMTAQGLEAVVTATMEAPPGIEAQIHAAVEASLAFLAADPRRGKMLMEARSAESVEKLRLASTRMIANAMSAMTRELLGGSAPIQLDSDLASFTMVSGVMELVAAWLRGEIDTSREHLTDLIAALLLSTADISTKLPGVGPGGSDHGSR
ncbi:TetR family transcriptional regulator [Nocardia sp. NPDC051030]|uniref:TetR/AcrR family transcriptional regulator n=1 Tax=Nocardia sp. NPDC051030 TaxID=3155162 RepID=UPI003414DAD8